MSETLRKTCLALMVLLVPSCGFPPPPNVPCTSTDQCAAGQVCIPSIGECTAQALDASDTADGSQNCTLDDECGSRICQPDGTCAPASSILYVDPDGLAAGDCTATAPCEIYYAKSKATDTRAAIRLNNGTYALIADLSVEPPLSSITIAGNRGAVVVRASSGPAIAVRNGSVLTVRGLSFGKGIAC